MSREEGYNSLVQKSSPSIYLLNAGMNAKCCFEGVGNWKAIDLGQRICLRKGIYDRP